MIDFKKLSPGEGGEAIVAMILIALGLIIMVTAFGFISVWDFSARMIVGSAVVGFCAVFIGNLGKRR